MKRLKKTGYKKLISMLKFVNKSKEPISKDKINQFGFSDNEIKEFTSRSIGSGGRTVGVNVQHITSTPLFIQVEADKSTYVLSGEGYKLLQDHWHIQASKISTWVMAVLAFVGLILSAILIFKTG